ncbi:MAG: hypothetical protein MPJ50_15045 [Pirellulales bacterium]|nr:hypothetical protein [Pirellulales bacterium]
MSTLPESTSRSEEDSAEQSGVNSTDTGAMDQEAAEDQEPSTQRGYDPDELQTRLKPHLSPKLAMGLPNVAITALFCVLFFIFSYLGLRPLDVYAHVALGDWILTQGSLPKSDPFLEVADGMPVDNSAWLSQTIWAGVHRLGGGEALSATFSLLKVAVFVMLGVVIFLRTRRLTFVGAGVVLLTLAYGMRLLESPVDVLGQLAFMTLLFLITREDLRTVRKTAEGDDEAAGVESALSRHAIWIAMPALFVAWVNLHISFGFGLILLAAWVLGRAWDTWKLHRSLSAVLSDVGVRRRVWLAEIALVATLANPMFLGAWRQVFQTALDANLRDQVQYAWLSFAGYHGLVLGVTLLLLMFLLRTCPALTGFDFLGVVAFAIATAVTVYAAPFLGAVVLVLASTHFSNRWRREEEPQPETPEQEAHDTRPVQVAVPSATDSVATPTDDTNPSEELPADALLAMEEDDEEFALPEGRSFVYSLVCVLLIFLSITFTPAFDMLAGNTEKQRAPGQLLGKNSPWRIADHLRENPIEGRVFASTGWASYLQFATRKPGEPIRKQYFANGMINHLPRRAWEDYMAMSGAGRNWEAVLDRYDIRYIIVDKEGQPFLLNGVRNSENWRPVADDDVAILMRRVFPEPSAAEDGNDRNENSVDNSPGTDQSSQDNLPGGDGSP